MDLLAELEEDRRKHAYVPCETCKFISALPEAERRKWEQAMKNKGFSASSLSRVLDKHGLKIGQKAVARHRRNHV